MKIEAENYEVIFGSNRILECKRVVEIVGKGVNKQIIRFREGEDGRILFNCNVNDQEGRTVAKVANSIIQHVMEGYEANITNEGIKVINKITGDIWLEFVYLSPRKFKLNGIFFLPGYKIIATDDYLEINTNKISNCTFKNCSSVIGLG